ncbi:hypothetical protein ACVXG9_04945 [Escherichia coli]
MGFKAKMQRKPFAKIEGLLLGAQQFRAPSFAQCRGCHMITIDGNGAVASVAFRTSEVIAIYPITPVPRWQNRLMPGPETA